MRHLNLSADFGGPISIVMVERGATREAFAESPGCRLEPPQYQGPPQTKSRQTARRNNFQPKE